MVWRAERPPTTLSRAPPAFGRSTGRSCIVRSPWLNPCFLLLLNEADRAEERTFWGGAATGASDQAGHRHDTGYDVCIAVLSLDEKARDVRDLDVNPTALPAHLVHVRVKDRYGHDPGTGVYASPLTSSYVVSQYAFGSWSYKSSTPCLVGPCMLPGSTGTQPPICRTSGQHPEMLFRYQFPPFPPGRASP